jgi:hypothetical protein
MRIGGRTEFRSKDRGAMVLFLYASHHIPGTDGADTRYYIDRVIGNLNRHDDATIGSKG